MTLEDINKKKLYDALINMISNLHMQKQILSRDEMHCLLSILDIVIMGTKDFGLIELLKEWEASELDPEINEIIKADLINIDFTNLDSIQRNLETIHDLLRYNKNLKES
jgi:hypothetical protein